MKITFLCSSPGWWPLGVLGTKCFCLLAADTKEWRAVRKEGWEGQWLRPKGPLGLHQETESLGNGGGVGGGARASTEAAAAERQ